jgi:hypothetical protein
MAITTIKPSGGWDSAGHYTPDTTRPGETTAHYELEMATYRDVATLPQTKWACARVCNGPVNSKYCCEYRTFYRFMYVTPTLIVDIGTIGDFLRSIQECHDNAVAAGFVSGVISACLSGGVAAAKAAVDTYTAVVGGYLKAKITTEPILSVRVEFRSHWSDSWE